MRVLHPEAALGEDGALGPARRARGVDDEGRVVVLDGLGGAVGGLAGDDVVPPEVPAGRPRDAGAGAAVDDHVLDARRLGHGLVGRLLHGHDMAPAHEGIRGDQHPGLASLEARGHCAGAVAREAGHVDGADARDGHHGDGGLLAHGQEDADPIAPTHPQPLEAVGQPRHLPAELGIGQRAHIAVLGLGDDGKLVAAGGEMPVHAVGGQIHPTAGEPARPLDAPLGVQHLGVGRRPRPAEVARDGIPVPLGLRDGSPLERLERREAVLLHEAGDAGARGRLGIRAPDDLALVHAGQVLSLTCGFTPRAA